MNTVPYFKLRGIITFLVIVLLVGLSIIVNAYAMNTEVQTQADTTDTQTALSHLPNWFEEKDVTKANVSFMTRGRGYTLAIHNTGHTIDLHSPSQPHGAQITMKIAEANAYSLHGNKQLPGKINYWLGKDQDKWRKNVNSYSEVYANNVYPGIDLRYYYANQNLEYDFIVEPKVSPNKIRLTFDGMEQLQVGEDGNLVLSTKHGNIHYKKPVIYQNIAGKRINIEGQYLVFKSSNVQMETSQQTQVGFDIGKYNNDYPLIIDPVLDYASYLGGSGPDQGSAIAVDDTGNIYITGTSFSVDVPTKSAYQDTNLARSDIFIAKFNPAGDTLLYATYLGGQDYDKATGISIDTDGNMIITGTTHSNDFPINNAIQTSYGGGVSDAFVSKLSADGSQLLFSSFIGGRSRDNGYSVTSDSQNNIYLTGETSSDDFPVNNAYQAYSGGHADAYIMKLNSNGSQSLYASYLGGSSYDSARSIAVDDRGYASITGTSYSKDFPLHNALQSEMGGGSDAFISQFNADGSVLNFSTYLGGRTEDQGLDIAIDSQNNVVIAGKTGNWFALAQQDDFPSKNAIQPQRGGLSDGFFSKLSADGSELIFSSYLGGDKDDTLTKVVIDDADNIVLSGTTESTTGLPVLNALQQTLRGTASDAYIAKFDSTGTTALFASYFGGSKADQGLGLAVKNQTLYLTGTTGSDTDFPSKNALQPLFGGGVDDMFVAKIGTGSNVDLQVDSISPNYINRDSHQLFTATGSNLANTDIVTSNAGLTIFDINASQDSITFRISAAKEAVLGDTSLTFSSTAGSADKVITVAPRLPSIMVSPIPVSTVVGTDPVSLDIHLSGIDVVDHTITLATSNSDIATITPNSITIPAGQKYPSATITITSSAKGSVSLDITSTTLNDIHTSIFVTENPYIPEVGEHTAISQALGIVVTKPAQPATLIEYGPFVSQLRLLKESTATGVEQTIGPILSPNLAVSQGNYLSAISPYAYLLESTTDMVISGQGLSNVTAVEIRPAEGITIGALNKAADGKSITVPLTLTAQAKQGLHQVILSTSTGHIASQTIRSDRIYITQGLPEIDSISPIIMVKGQTAILKVRGRNLKQTQSVTLTPSDGITVGSAITINESGTELNLALAVSEAATIGARAVVVTTPAGSSTVTASAANTLTINSEVGDYYPGITSPELGLLKGNNTVAHIISHSFYSATVGLSKGATLTAISPKVTAIDSTFELTLHGTSLQNIDAVRVEPSQGITVGQPTANSDGKTVTVSLTVDSAAAQTKRRIIASENGVDISASSPTADQLLITALQPEIHSMTPNYLLAGSSVTVTIQGRYLNNAQAVVLNPADKLSASSPTVNTEGTKLTVTLTASADATAGERLLKVLTPGGETSSVSVPTNTLTVITDVAQIRPVYTASLGVQKETVVPTVTTNFLQLSPLLGISKEKTPSVVTQTIAVSSSSLGMVVGAIADSITPKTLPIETETAITVTGIGLDRIQSISFSPNDGITQTGSLTVSSDNTTLALPVTVAADAIQDARQMVLHTESGTVPFISATADRIKIVDNVSPQISSLAPIQQVAGASFTLTINGSNLQDTVAVAISPSQGISVSTPTLSADKSQITVNMIIASDATIGGRVVTVQTLSGESTTTASAANTFSVVNQ